MTIKITNKTLLGSLSSIHIVSTFADGMEVGNVQKLARWLRKLNDEIDAYETGRKELLRRHWKKGDDGQPLPEFVADSQARFDEEFAEYLAQEIEIKIPMVDLSFFGTKSKLNAGQLCNLDWWIKNPAPDGEE